MAKKLDIIDQVMEGDPHLQTKAYMQMAYDYLKSYGRETSHNEIIEFTVGFMKRYNARPNVSTIVSRFSPLWKKSH